MRWKFCSAHRKNPQNVKKAQFFGLDEKETFFVHPFDCVRDMSFFLLFCERSEPKSPCTAVIIYDRKHVRNICIMGIQRSDCLYELEIYLFGCQLKMDDEEFREAPCCVFMQRTEFMR